LHNHYLIARDGCAAELSVARSTNASKLARSRCKANALFLRNPRSRRDVCCRATTDPSFSAKRDSRAINYRGPRGILCTRGEKEHTSKRVSIIAPDNAISEAKCATCETAMPPNSPLHAPLTRVNSPVLAERRISLSPLGFEFSLFTEFKRVVRPPKCHLKKYITYAFSNAVLRLIVRAREEASNVGKQQIDLINGEGLLINLLSAIFDFKKSCYTK